MRDKLNFFQSISFTLACMVGTGIFTSLGFQLQSMDDVGWIMLLWIAGGLVAFLGSLIYASLGTAMPGNGGEVLYLSALIHPVFGYISAWVSLVAGFAAPAAASALTAASYLGYFYPGFPQKIGASIIVFALTAIHLKSISVSGKSQFYLTLVKIFIIVVFIIMCFGLGKMNISANNQNLFFSKKLDLSAFGVSLLYVLYTYSGWNAFGYFAGYVENPSKNIPRIALAAVLV
ncbi:MAG: amino acid permease, partial [Bacteroidia bacterium]|nr:amino acid permease [Bacteroidia bacterium]